MPRPNATDGFTYSVEPVAATSGVRQLAIDLKMQYQNTEYVSDHQRKLYDG
jgi:hypothetical protein